MSNAAVSQRVFSKYDRDRSGVLSRWEFAEMVTELGYKLSPAELDLAVKTLDTDGGGISYKEFQAWWRTDKRFEKLQLSDAELSRLQQAQGYFNYFDKDRSGTISKEEFRSLHADLIKHRYPLPPTPEAALAKLDGDGSGQVSFNEFIDYLHGLGGFK
jgi:Ca2+-binding EF-hand superfamily protein